MNKWERRRTPSSTPSTAAVAAELPPVDLPVDYLRLVEKTLTDALQPGLVELRKTHPISEFSANGAIYSDEVLLAITLSHGTNNLAATTLYASTDFNPLIGKPSLEAILSACLDAVGTVLEYYLDAKQPERVAQLGHHSLSALDEAPFEWTTFEAEAALDEDGNQVVKIPVWVKMDKSNPTLDALTERWLIENDPEYKTQVIEKEKVGAVEAEDFLDERLDAIKKAGSGSGMPGGNGPITH